MEIIKIAPDGSLWNKLGPCYDLIGFSKMYPNYTGVVKVFCVFFTLGGDGDMTFLGAMKETKFP